MGAFVKRSDRLRGMRLGGYEIVRVIGHGATASVFEATHIGLGKQVAIKVLHEHLVADEQLQGRFLREGRIAARLSHPNTVSVLDVGTEAGHSYLVMELLAGNDLRTLLADVRRLSIEHALAFLLPIASALAQAHDAGILHRDLKPANIFLSRDIRGDVVPKLVDFGLSKIIIGDGKATSSLTSTELVAGTVLYMAPEQTLGVKNCSPASDQYSLAAILYECVTSEAPFMADGVYVLLEMIRTESPRPPSQRSPVLPKELDAVVLRALDRDPSKRFPSVRAFAAALLPFASTETIHALERDFLERASARTPAASQPSVREAIAAAETMEEKIDEPAGPVEAARSAEPSRPALSASAIRAVDPLPCPPGASPFRIKGMAYRGFVNFLGRVPGGLNAFCDALEDDRLRAFVRQPFLATARYDILPFLPFYSALSRVLDKPFDELVRKGGAAQARYDAQTVFRAMWSTVTPENITERIGRLGPQYYDFGKYTSSLPEPHMLVTTHVGIPAYVSPWYSVMHRAYTEESLRMLKGIELVSTTQTCVLGGKRGGFALATARTEARWRSVS